MEVLFPILFAIVALAGVIAFFYFDLMALGVIH